MIYDCLSGNIPLQMIKFEYGYPHSNTLVIFFTSKKTVRMFGVPTVSGCDCVKSLAIQ